MDFLKNQESLEEFLKRHVKPYDPSTDGDNRPPFAADIREGKNDPIYNAHSYHTKVPPRGILPYILHYTKAGDIVLDPFCGSGMTGVAAQICVNPPADILAQFPDLKDRVGPRACIMNDLSPAACHIAYNYNTPVDIDTLKREFERVKAAVKEEFDWLYGTEHYEPAFGSYALSNTEVLARLKNPPKSTSSEKGNKGDLGLLFPSETERTWTLLTRHEVEDRLGYPVTELPREKTWKDMDIAKVTDWISIPATIQYTIWSDIYRCEGFITIEEPTGKMSTKGKNAGKAMTVRRRVARGCGKEITLWDAAIDGKGEVLETFKCPHCSTPWKKMQIARQSCLPMVVSLSAVGMRQTKKGVEPHRVRYQRKFTDHERRALAQIESTGIPYWVPDTEMDPKGPQYRRNALQVRKIKKVTDFWTHRNLFAYGSLWEKAKFASDERVAAILRFALTGITYYVTKKQAWGSGGGGLSGQLYLSSFPLEKNVWAVFERKIEQIIAGFHAIKSPALGQTAITVGSATRLAIPDQSIDYVFTDPPFGSNIYYSEPNLLWEAWLGLSTDIAEEAVVHRKNDGGTKRLSDYARLMDLAFGELFRVLKPGRWCTVEFNNSDGAVFEAIKDAIRKAGFEIANMLLLDKQQKTFKQIKGAEGAEDVVDKDVLFNLNKPSIVGNEIHSGDHDLEQQITDIVRQHLQGLPERIKTEPTKYSDDYRTTATINSLLMNALIPIGVNVGRLNLPYIERVCGRYFRKVGQRWYLRGEAIGNGTSGGLFEEEVQIKDEESAIAWLRQRLTPGPKTIGELKPLWMRGTGLLPLEISQQLDLDALLRENFWKDTDTNRWREPTSEEREKMNDSRTLHVLHDAERFLVGSLKRQFSDSDRCDWIDVLFNACRSVEERENEELPALRDFDSSKGYQMISQLFHGILKDHVPPDIFIRAEKQARVASSRLKDVGSEEKQEKKKSKNKMQLEFDW